MRKKAFSCFSAFSELGSRRFFLKFFVYKLYTQRKIKLKCGLKTGKQKFFFALNTLNTAERLVCAEIISKKCEYLLKRHYRTWHTILRPIMGCEQSALVT